MRILGFVYNREICLEARETGFYTGQEKLYIFRYMNGETAWYWNTTIWAGITAWVVAQLCKLLVTLFETRRFDHGFLLRLGGMPSSHSASMVAVATSVGLRMGFNSPLFAVALGLALIVMVDAQSVRRAAGQQARILNQMVEELFKEHHLSQQKLVEFLGHTRMEVLLGAILGVVTAFMVHALWFEWFGATC